MKASLLLASLLYRFSFPLYRIAYYRFKRRQDGRLLQLMKEHYSAGNILDIGANIGFYCGHFASMVNHGKVFCFEPDRENFAKLRRYHASQAVVLEQVAVSDTSGTLDLYVSPLLNVDHRTYRPDESRSSYPVAAMRIDDYRGLAPVGLIKMDIQGYEFHALKGMEQTLRANPAVNLFMELWPYGLARSGSSAVAVFRLLRSWGFEIFLVSPEGLDELTEDKVESLPVGEFAYFNVFARRNLAATRPTPSPPGSSAP